jgi:5-methylcytosine-specific restriction endonuclease McrA
MTRVADELHHTVKRADDLSRFYDDTNVTPLCKEHHAARTRRGE